MVVQAVAILLVVAVHDALLVLVGCVLANKFYGLSPGASHVALNQALRVYGNPTRGNPIQSSQRYQVLLPCMNCAFHRAWAIRAAAGNWNLECFAYCHESGCVLDKNEVNDATCPQH